MDVSMESTIQRLLQVDGAPALPRRRIARAIGAYRLAMAHLDTAYDRTKDMDLSPFTGASAMRADAMRAATAAEIELRRIAHEYGCLPGQVEG